MKSLERIVCLDSSSVLDVGVLLSAIEYLIAVTYLIQLFGDREQVVPFLPN